MLIWKLCTSSTEPLQHSSVQCSEHTSALFIQASLSKHWRVLSVLNDELEWLCMKNLVNVIQTLFCCSGLGFCLQNWVQKLYSECEVDSPVLQGKSVYNRLNWVLAIPLDTCLKGMKLAMPQHALILYKKLQISLLDLEIMPEPPWLCSENVKYE